MFKKFKKLFIYFVVALLLASIFGIQGVLNLFHVLFSFEGVLVALALLVFVVADEIDKAYRRYHNNINTRKRAERGC